MTLSSGAICLPKTYLTPSLYCGPHRMANTKGCEPFTIDGQVQQSHLKSTALRASIYVKPRFFSFLHPTCVQFVDVSSYLDG